MSDNNIKIAVTYRHEWDDGFGARGWKLDYSLYDPDVIAATADTGSRIPTSVLVHDILDHHLCGLPLSGHRNEAIALVQLGLRTGSSPEPDFAGMVDEDLMRGQVNGESMRTFLPNDLRERLPIGETEGRQVINLLRQQLGEPELRQRLIGRFFELGEAEREKVKARWNSRGLDYHRRDRLGLALQRILASADRDVYEQLLEEAHGHFSISNSYCALYLNQPVQLYYKTTV